MRIWGALLFTFFFLAFHISPLPAEANRDGCVNDGDTCRCSNTGWMGRCNYAFRQGLVCRCNPDGCMANHQPCRCSNTGWRGRCEPVNGGPGLQCRCNPDGCEKEGQKCRCSNTGKEGQCFGGPQYRGSLYCHCDAPPVVGRCAIPGQHCRCPGAPMPGICREIPGKGLECTECRRPFR